jgi:hypothetical protein
MIKHCPCKSDDQTKNITFSTNDNNGFIFGQASAFDFIIHKDEARKQRYINRHKNNEV